MPFGKFCDYMMLYGCASIMSVIILLYLAYSESFQNLSILEGGNINDVCSYTCIQMHNKINILLLVDVTLKVSSIIYIPKDTYIISILSACDLLFFAIKGWHQGIASTKTHNNLAILKDICDSKVSNYAR